MTAGITRSGGTVVTGPFGGSAFVVGGGYSGLTDELDATVARAAELLRDAFEWDVEIRFNSDRESGGAWLVTPQRSDFWRNCEVSLGAQLVPLMKGGYDPERFLELIRAEQDALPREVRVSSSMNEGVMRDPSLIPADANDGTNGRSWYEGHSTLEDGIRHLLAHVDRAVLGTTRPKKA